MAHLGSHLSKRTVETMDLTRDEQVYNTENARALALGR